MMNNAVRTASRVAWKATNHLKQPRVVVRNFAASTPLDAVQVTERIVDVIKSSLKVDTNKVTPECSFTDDLALDAVDSMEVVMAIEDEFAIDIPDKDAEKILSIPAAVQYIVGQPMAK
eukprot:CAMPEP_0202458112 /NCGR_PEP_ID=MMETSP1360-20130828/21630_1 /ASSEMBLY_ACC=CAM_ASM_000848 /TAXON_ID=515479 /ORGANISM="Licmophora paradoxa, Strain CCMP2313" /LENGTH=117 /DNA_ID=CAMNT_0049078491 /DNA_START=11 /DNA_END=364 /DNA_ORIENTATION=-